MVLFIILAILVVILIAIGVLFYMRSNKRNLIEKTEERKNEIEQLPLDDNLRKLTGLNLKGETKTKYDAMKKDNTETTNKYLAPVEEKIQNAEELLEKFKFTAAQTEIDDAHELMDQYEENYQHQVTQVDDIINLHKENEALYEKCKVDYREMKRDVLANRHQFGEAAEPLENEIENYEPKLNEYENLKSEGNYVQAHNHIAALEDQIKNLKSYMDEIPELIRETQKELPGQFQDLKYGCRDLKVEGYDLDHVKVDGTIQSLKTELSFVEPMISRLELDEANNKLENINDKLDEVDKNKFNILLAHNPLFIEEYSEWGADLVLAGHMHGGIIRIPIIGIGIASPEGNYFPKYDAGEFKVGNTTMIVNRGIGASSGGLRVFNKPEISVITLKSK